MARMYCGIDLHASTMQVCVTEQNLSRVLDRTVRNDLAALLFLLRPFGPDLSIAVESTFNWYWLVDGLQDAGYDVHLAHTLGLYMITKAKVKTDRRDAFTLAKLLATGMLPEAYVYPKGTRTIRDIVRHRSRLVAIRAHGYAALRLKLYQHGILGHTRNSAKVWDGGDIEALVADPSVRILCSHELERITLLTRQIKETEEMILKAASDKDGYGRLKNVPGLGKALCAIIFYETGDVSRFRSARHYASYCRLVPGTATSGGRSKRGRGSKQGNPHLKSAFTQAAQCAIRHYPDLRAFYDRQAACHQGRASKLIATDILGHRLAQAVYHILKEGTDYDKTKLFQNHGTGQGGIPDSLTGTIPPR